MIEFDLPTAGIPATPVGKQKLTAENAKMERTDHEPPSRQERKEKARQTSEEQRV